MSDFVVDATTVEFIATEEAWSEPATSAVSVRGFPGGDNWAISLGGQREVTRTFTAVFASRTVYVSMALLRGKLGTLTVDGWDTTGIDAVLRETAPEPPLPDGQIAARLSFILA